MNYPPTPQLSVVSSAWLDSWLVRQTIAICVALRFKIITRRSKDLYRKFDNIRPWCFHFWYTADLISIPENLSSRLGTILVSTVEECIECKSQLTIRSDRNTTAVIYDHNLGPLPDIHYIKYCRETGCSLQYNTMAITVLMVVKLSTTTRIL